MYRALAFLLTVLLSTVCLSGQDEIQGFDFDRCIWWGITDELLNYDEKNLALQQQAAAEGWLLYEAERVYPSSDRREPVQGFCRWGNDKSGSTRVTLTCKKTVGGFPLAGASYRLVKGKKGLDYYQCFSGCAGVGVKKIHDLGYESEGENVSHTREHKAFSSMCQGKKTGDADGGPGE